MVTLLLYYLSLLLLDGFFFPLSPSISWLFFGSRGSGDTHLTTLMPLFSNVFLLLSIISNTVKHMYIGHTQSTLWWFISLKMASRNQGPCTWAKSMIFVTLSQLGTVPIRILPLTRAINNCHGEMWLYMMLTWMLKKSSQNTTVSLESLYGTVISAFLKTFMMIFMSLTRTTSFMSKIKYKEIVKCRGLFIGILLHSPLSPTSVSPVLPYCLPFQLLKKIKYVTLISVFQRYLQLEAWEENA